MLVQPVPVGPRSRRRRALTRAALAVPALLLAGVLAAGVLGSPPAGTGPTADAPGWPTGSGTLPARTARPTAPARPATSPRTAVRALATHPERVLGMPVLTVEEALAARRAGDLGGIVAIGGYLGLRELPAACRETRLGPFGAFCERHGILATRPWTAGDAIGGIGPHLHPQFPVGVRVPHRVAEVARSGWSATPAVVVARFDDLRADPCQPAGRHCGEELVVERVAWVDGEDYPRTLTIDPSLATQPEGQAAARPAASQASMGLPGGSIPLLTALVRPETIPVIDPAMAPIVEDLALDTPGAWYVRAIDDATAPRAIAWVVADAAGRVLATGSLPLRP